MPTAPCRPLEVELVEFIESGVSTVVGTRNASFLPDCVRAVGAQVARDRLSVAVLLNEATAARALANIAAGSPVAVTFNRPIDHRTVQIKGRALAVRPGGDAEKAIAERYLAAFTEALYAVGMSRALVRRLRVFPCVAVDVEACELFQQTPGPSAGTPLRGAG